jgi:transposase-like protein
VLIGKEAVSKVCEELQLQPSQLYLWQQQLFERGAAVFEREDRRERLAASDRIAALEAKLQRKDSVMAELMEEHVKLKKSLGEP